jgi:hypothetical protein
LFQKWKIQDSYLFFAKARDSVLNEKEKGKSGPGQGVSSDRNAMFPFSVNTQGSKFKVEVLPTLQSWCNKSSFTFQHV